MPFFKEQVFNGVPYDKGEAADRRPRPRLSRVGRSALVTAIRPAEAVLHRVTRRAVMAVAVGRRVIVIARRAQVMAVPAHADMDARGAEIETIRLDRRGCAER